ncbi:MAG: hypothetical protein ACYDBB_02210 [Armatimonadota bacterium]
MTVSPSLADPSQQLASDAPLPFALLVIPAKQNRALGTTVSRRTAGEVLVGGTLSIKSGEASFSGNCDSDYLTEHRTAIARAADWLPHVVEGDFPVRWCKEHRAVVETDGESLLLDCQPVTGLTGALALAWIAAIVAYREQNPRAALRAVASVFRALPANEQAAIRSALADSAVDAGSLCEIFLTRVARETSEDELERWESWFLGQREIDLPYNRKAVIEILESETIDPDEKRLLIHDVVQHYDKDVEKANIARTVAKVRKNNQELVFGRMSRAFHNQSLLFANAGYLQVDEMVDEKMHELAIACTGSARLAPAIDRLRTLIQGATETAMTGALGALELLENAILDDQRQAIDTALKADREGRKRAATSKEILVHAEHLLDLCHALRQAFLTAPRRPAAYVLLSQRIFPLETHLLSRINELQEPYLGKPDNLKMLVRKGGHRMYSSPDYSWLQHSDHWVEAIPLFIKERVLVVDGVEITETVIDQQAMEETFREQFADHWALGIDNVMDSEYVSLARELLARDDERVAGDDRARAAAVIEHGLAARVGLLAALIANAYRMNAEAIHLLAEQRGLLRYDALREWLQENVLCGDQVCINEAFATVMTDQEQIKQDTERLAEIADRPRRALPSLHVLTTQSARMSDSYVRTWLEESMALFNVIRAHRLEGEVNERMAGFRAMISLLGARLIRELGMWAEVEELMANENLPEGVAIFRVVAGNPAINRQLCLLAVLAEHFGLQPDQEAPLVDELLKTKADELQAKALRAVYDRNDLELLPQMDAYLRANPHASEADAINALILGNPDYADDMTAFIRFAAREEAIHELDRQDATLELDARVRDWLRNHSRLSLTTARRETLLAHGLNHLTLHPLYYYRAAGGNKRFHQLYTPSRVDLGTHERESVETWSQWVGGCDRAAARVGRRAYSLINKNVKMFDSLTEPEVLKSGENASMVANFSYSNAMSLLVNSVGRGDVEEIGDQMSLRKDRLIRPGGEGYGGYCVPKDGLFLEFVLILTRATKLRQLGVADHLHAGVVAFAHYLLSRREEFACEIEWEAWAMQLVTRRDELANFFSLRDGAVPVFQITRIAKALTQLGRPELTDSFDVLANLAARWGIHKIIVGGEQVNRFMPFFKVWLTYQAIEDAKRLNPLVKVNERDFSVVLSAEYKPNTQDGRFSVGMRKYEMYAGTGEHLTYSLDVPGQDLVQLMFRGFEHLWQNRTDPRLRARLTRLLKELQVREDDEAAINKLRALYPGYQPPAEIRMVSPMKLTTSDLLHYTSDTALEHLAEGVKRRLLNIGLTESEIEANMLVYGPRLAQWTKVRDLPAEELQTLIDSIGGNIHALALSIIGPAGNYEMSVQGADVIDTGIPHDDLRQLLEDPVKVRELMLEGNPNSALVLVDGASGARHRALNRLAVMRWFAAGEAIGRQSIYRCVGIGSDTIESWREEMRHQRERARALYEALAAGNVGDAKERFAAIIADLRDEQESVLFLETEERMIRFGQQTPQEAAVARALAELAAGQQLEELDFATWLGLGGQFWLIGAPQAKLAEVRALFEKGIATLSGAVPLADEMVIATLYVPAYVPAVEEFREEKGIESSNKATEEVAAVAIDTRKRLAERAARAKAMHEREAAFQEMMERFADKSPTVEELITQAHAVRGDGTTMSQVVYGQMQALTRLAMIALGRELFTQEPEHFKQLTAHLELALFGQILDPFYARPLIGGYEDMGDIARMAQVPVEACQQGKIDQAERDRQLERIADVSELFDTCKAIGLTIDFFWLEADAYTVWRALADFFAESLNDHFYEYRPWVYSRGIGYAHLKGDALYDLAVRHHQWIYRYLKNIALAKTELQNYTAEEIVNLLGDMDTAAEQPPIGADAGTPTERRWRAYNQLRELAFIRNDGFPLPQVFPVFDPEIIEADTRTNLLFMYPVGRTHISKAMMESPTLSDELKAKNRPGINLLLTRDAVVAELPEYSQPVLQAYNAHVYISKAEYVTALMKHRGLAPAEAEKLAESHAGPKGVRVAARFTRPITVGLIFPFHGNPKYDSGLLEDLGLPYSCQCLFHTWTTYDKAKYPDIFCAETGVEIPGEMDWLVSYTAKLGEEASYHALEFGDERLGFPGLRAFAQRFRRVMVKDAAESGGRGQKAFNLRNSDGSLDETAIAEAKEFIYQISLKHNVAIQEVIIASPEYWATEEFMGSFVDRQVQEWGAAVNRTRRPRTNVYGSQRLIFSSGDPRIIEWRPSHPITLNSRQLITNVGRGGTLDLFKPEMIRPEFRDQLWSRMEEAGLKCMKALARYGEVAREQYEQESGRKIGQDATGLSYAVPRYMMLDFLVQPIFAEEGALIDLQPVYDADGQRTGVHYILQQGEQRVNGTVKDWRVVLIEPNIGIGLWDRLALREQYYYAQATETPDWHAVGANARIVLSDFAQAGTDYLNAVKK